MYSWKNVTRKEKRETNNLPTAKNYRQRNHISTNDLKKLDLNYERTTVHIPHVVVIQPKQEDILAIGPELIDGSKVRSEAKETMRMSQVFFTAFLLMLTRRRIPLGFWSRQSTMSQK